MGIDIKEIDYETNLLEKEHLFKNKEKAMKENGNVELKMVEES